MTGLYHTLAQPSCAASITLYPAGSPSEPWPQRPTKPGKWCVNESRVNRAKRMKKKNTGVPSFFFFLFANVLTACHRFRGEVRKKQFEMPTRRRNGMTPLAAVYQGWGRFSAHKRRDRWREERAVTTTWLPLLNMFIAVNKSGPLMRSLAFGHVTVQSTGTCDTPQTVRTASGAERSQGLRQWGT